MAAVAVDEAKRKQKEKGGRPVPSQPFQLWPERSRPFLPAGACSQATWRQQANGPVLHILGDLAT